MDDRTQTQKTLDLIKDEWQSKARRELLDQIISGLRNSNNWIEDDAYADWVDRHFDENGRIDSREET